VNKKVSTVFYEQLNFPRVQDKVLIRLSFKNTPKITIIMISINLSPEKKQSEVVD